MRTSQNHFSQDYFGSRPSGLDDRKDSCQELIGENLVDIVEVRNVQMSSPTVFQCTLFLHHIFGRNVQKSSLSVKLLWTTQLNSELIIQLERLNTNPVSPISWALKHLYLPGSSTTKNVSSTKGEMFLVAAYREPCSPGSQPGGRRCR